MAGEALHIYTVCFPKFDSKTQLHGCLYTIRKNYFESGISEKQVITDRTDGICTKYSYYISHWGMGWKKMVDNRLLEYSVPNQDGCAIIFQDGGSHFYAKSIYNVNLDWEKTCYYDKYSDQDKILYSIELENDYGVLNFIEYEEDGTVRCETKLYPGFSDVNTEVHDKLDEMAGKPLVYATSNRGEVCFCPAVQAKRRGEVMEDIIGPHYSSLNLEDVMASTFDWDDRGAQLFAECVLLLRGEDPAEKQDIVELIQESEANEQIDDIEDELNRTIRETEEWIRSLNQRGEEDAEMPAEPEEDLYSYSSAEAQQDDADVAEIMSLIQSIEDKNQREEESYDRVIRDSIGSSLKEKLRTEYNGQHVTRYTVAGKKSKGRMVHASDVFETEKKRNRAV